MEDFKSQDVFVGDHSRLKIYDRPGAAFMEGQFGIHNAGDENGPGVIIVPFSVFELTAALRMWSLIQIEEQLSVMLRQNLPAEDFEFFSTEVDYVAGHVRSRYEPQ